MDWCNCYEVEMYILDLVMIWSNVFNLNKFYVVVELLYCYFKFGFEFLLYKLYVKW